MDRTGQRTVVMDGKGRDGMVGTMEGMVDIITGFVANLGRDRTEYSR